MSEITERSAQKYIPRPSGAISNPTATTST